MGQTYNYNLPKRAVAEITLSFDRFDFNEDEVQKAFKSAIKPLGYKCTYEIKKKELNLRIFIRTRRFVTISSIWPLPEDSSITYAKWSGDMYQLAESLAKKSLNVVRCELVFSDRDTGQKTNFKIPVAKAS